MQRVQKNPHEHRILRCTAAAFLSVLCFLFTSVFRTTGVGFLLLIPAGALMAFHEENRIARIIIGILSVLPFFLLKALFGASHSPVFVLFAVLISSLSSDCAGNLLTQSESEVRFLQRRIQREQSISTLSGELLTTTDKDELYERTLQSLYRVLGYPCVLFTPLSDGQFLRRQSIPEGLMLYPADALLQYCANRGKRCGRGTDYQGDSPLTVLPVKGEHSLLAVAVILTGTSEELAESALVTAEHLLVRTGIAMERLTFLEREHNILIEKELEHMRSDFLRSISHDLRTPLTGILGACTAMEEKDVVLQEQDRKELVRSIQEEASWLLRVVENLLSVTRVGSSGPKLNCSEEPVEEILAEVLDKTKNRFPDVNLHVSQPDEFVLIPVDPTLIVQVLMNLIDNAVKYAPDAPIELRAAEEEQSVCFTVRDHGPGLSDEAQANLFEPTGHHTGDYGHGMGLGLSICRSIIIAHGGTIEGENAPGGGAVFTVNLPKERV